MSKTMIPFTKSARDKNGNRVSKKSLSHGTMRCKRKPNSKRCLNGSMAQERYIMSSTEEKLYTGLTPKNDNLTTTDWGGRVHLRKLEPMAAMLHRKKKEMEEANARQNK